MTDAEILRVLYSVNKDQVSQIFVPSNSTTDQVIHLIQIKEGNPDLKYIFRNGCRIETELFKDFFNPKEVYDVTANKDEIFNHSDNDERVIPSKPSTTSHTIQKEKFTLYATILPNSMLYGTQIEFIKDEMDATTVKSQILEFIKNTEPFSSNIPDVDNLQVHLFLPNAIPFVSGTFLEWNAACDGNKRVLYAVVTRDITRLLNQEYQNICDCSADDMKLLLSPLYDSTEIGLTQISSLMGYFYYDGQFTEVLLRKLAALTGFAPFVSCLYNIITQGKITGLTIATVTSTIQTLIQHYLPHIPKNQLFEHTLSLLTYLLKGDIKTQPNLFVYQFTDEIDDDEDDIIKYLRTHGNIQKICLWDKDKSDVDFILQEIPKPDERQLLRSFNSGNSLRPISPLSLQYVYEPTFVRMEKPTDETNLAIKVQLFIENVLEGGKRKGRMVKIINPIEGKIKEVDYDELAKTTGDTTIDEEMRKKGGKSLQQIIYICLDASTSMRSTLLGKSFKGKEPTRMKLSKIFLQQVLKRIYDFRIRSALGLITFGQEIKNVCPLSISDKDLSKSIDEVTSFGNDLWYTAVDQAADLMIQFNKAPDNTLMYPDAQQRIILISDADDNEIRKGESIEAVLSHLAEKLTSNHIILDQIMLNHQKDCTRAMAVSKISGGLCFRPNNEGEGIELFETEAFIDITTRSMNGIIENINPTMFKEIVNEIEHDDNKYTTIETITKSNINMKKKEMVFTVGEAKTMASYFSKPENHPTSVRENRILEELIRIAHNPNANIKVYVCKNNISQWRVFIKAPDGTPYSGVWWDLSVYFPDTYPRTPPDFRYLTIPYHQNVSKEGKILCTALEEKYKSSKHILKILERLRQLFADPEDSHTLIESIQKCRTETPEEFNEKTSRLSRENAYDNLNSNVIRNFTIVEDENGDLPNINNEMLVTHVYRGKILHIDSDDDDI